MNASTQRADEPHLPPVDAPLNVSGDESTRYEPAFDSVEWSETRAERDDAAAGGRAVLGSALVLLAALWIGYSAWSAGRALADAPLGSPAFAQWVAIAAGPLALLGLAWIMFGRTRRKEAERFTASVIAMRTEARSLEGLLGVLRTRIDESHAALGSMARQLMQLGDEATDRLGAATREFGEGTALLSQHGAALDKAAGLARVDIGVLLDDLPRAEASARAMAAALQGAGQSAVSQAAAFEGQVAALTTLTREADETVGSASQRLVAHLTQIESAGAAAAAQVIEAGQASGSEVDAVLNRAAQALDEIRTGIDAQAAAVAALVDQAKAGIGRAGVEAAGELGSRLAGASNSLDTLSARVAEQERASQRMIADLDTGLAALDERFSTLARAGDARAAAMIGALARTRAELEALVQQSDVGDIAVEELANRTAALRQGIETLSAQVREGLAGALGEAESGATRLLAAAEAARPEIAWMREASIEASERIEASGQGIDAQQDRFAALLAAIDEGVGNAGSKLTALTEAIGTAEGEAARLSSETGPALVAAMVQVREAASHAAERAREAISAVIPEGAERLSRETRDALERAIREGIEDQLRDVEHVAARAVEAAKSASDRLTQQMLTIGQSAAALEAHIDRTGATQRANDSEAFARRVSLLIDSMHSASIDVGKILSDEIDDKAWNAYLKGNRGVFTRRAVRLMESGEARAIAAHYESDPEFQGSVNRYVHDFEAMLRRVLAERDGGMIAVTLMSSDMGKLYAALGQAVDRRR
jgi:hypothetical protein